MDTLKIKKYLHQMLSGIADCHMKRIIHRDLKPANILIDVTGGICNFIQRISKLVILVLLVHFLYQFVHILNKLLLYGTEHLKFYQVPSNIQLLLISGQLVVFLLKWLQKRPCLQEIVTLINFIEYLEFQELLIKQIGQVLQN